MHKNMMIEEFNCNFHE